jgi:site-specific DNA-cytosine methylase
MRVLVACEFSGIVREAFRARGHEAYSCDLEEADSRWHLRTDVFKLLVHEGGFLDHSWDLMIAHPPCTHLAVSGARWFKNKQEEQAKAIKFFMALVEAPVEKICIENPIGIMSRLYRKPDQIIQPWQFGHPEAKATCLWLKNLPKLLCTNILDKPDRGYWDNQTPSGQNKLGPSPDRWKIRSRTYQGIANAMAEQWG